MRAIDAGMSESIQDNLRRVRERIGNAAIAAGRRPEDITLVAVSKTKPVEAVVAALDAGQMVFGENRVQEAADKFPGLRQKFGLHLHIIGGLQTNKAREAVRIADVIKSLDRPKLADTVEAAMAKEGRRPGLLIEVNTGGEAQKSGVGRDEADNLLSRAGLVSEQGCWDSCASRRTRRILGRTLAGWPIGRRGMGWAWCRWGCRRISRWRLPAARPGFGSGVRFSGPGEGGL